MSHVARVRGVLEGLEVIACLSVNELLTPGQEGQVLEQSMQR